MKLHLALVPLAGILMIGCGGELSADDASIAGRVVDSQGLPVRGARVYTIDSETTTSSNGAYQLTGNRADFISVFAEIDKNGITYRGRNVVRTVGAQQQQSINITIAPIGQLAEMRGVVRDRVGRLVEGASVFAFNDGNLSSARAVTEADGTYRLPGLIGGLLYTVTASAQGYANDTDDITLTAGNDFVANFTLGDAGFPILPRVTDLAARAWTSPAITRSDRFASAYENIKRRWDPNRASASTRSTFSGSPIEVQLDWTRLEGPDFLGYGIYRTQGTGTPQEYDFYREPLAGTYIDADVNLRENRVYRYGITALGTLFPEDADSEGELSNVVQVETLGDLEINPVPPTGSVVFSWRNGSGAERYVVYLFDEFPGIGVESIWNTESRQTSNLSFTYDGPALVNGRRYYYLVLGLANSNTSRTLSTVGEFVN